MTIGLLLYEMIDLLFGLRGSHLQTLNMTTAEAVKTGCQSPTDFLKITLSWTIYYHQHEPIL